MKAIGKEGRVFRLSKESWDMLIPYDTDPNHALKKIQAALNKPVIQTANSTGSPVHECQHNSPCKFDEKNLRKIVKEEMESVIAPFTGG